MSLAEKILDFMGAVHYEGQLPDGIHIMNPYRESEDIRSICSAFYHKFYADTQPRKIILGINPGRLGAGATGLPFTDTVRLTKICEIDYTQFSTYEPSSVFIYDMIEAFGGVDKFYSMFYINSVCPLGFVSLNGTKTINYNYYDSKKLQVLLEDFIVSNIKMQKSLVQRSDVCFCLGAGKNYTYLSRLNDVYGFFDKVVPLEHPRYIMQYKHKQKAEYIQDYLQKLME